MINSQIVSEIVYISLSLLSLYLSPLSPSLFLPLALALVLVLSFSLDCTSPSRAATRQSARAVVCVGSRAHGWSRGRPMQAFYQGSSSVKAPSTLTKLRHLSLPHSIATRSKVSSSREDPNLGSFHCPCCRLSGCWLLLGCLFVLAFPAH